MIFLIKFVKEICFCSRKYLTFIFSYWRLSKRELSKFLSYLSEYFWRLKYYRWTIYVYQINSKADEISPSQINSKVPISQKVFFVQDIYFPAPSEDYCDSLYTSRCIVPSFFSFFFSLFFPNSQSELDAGKPVQAVELPKTFEAANRGLTWEI